mgnify:FL=1
MSDIKDLVKGVGSFKIKEDNTGKYLTCTSTGKFAFQSFPAFGTWQFEIYKKASSDVINYWFVSDTASGSSGYSLSFTNNNAIILYKDANILFSTNNNYISSEVWYSFKITRALFDKKIYVYIKGGTFADWTLVTASTGTNPIADATYVYSKFNVIELTANDGVKNILIKDGVMI